MAFSIVNIQKVERSNHYKYCFFEVFQLNYTVHVDKMLLYGRATVGTCRLYRSAVLASELSNVPSTNTPLQNLHAPKKEIYKMCVVAHN